MAYTKYSLTPADNNAAPPNGAPEGMLPSAVNDTMRDMMAQIRDAGDGIRGGTYTMTAPVITGGSITGVALSGNTFTSPVITGGSINNTPIGATTPSTGVFTTLGASGVATFSAGTVSAPAITTTGDTNTGIYFPAADTIAFTEGGVESMRIDSSGNVGIGAMPETNQKLTVNGAILCKAAGAEGGQVDLLNIGNSSIGMSIDVEAADVGRIFSTRNGFQLRLGQLTGTGGSIQFFTAGLQRFNINSAGALELRTTAGTPTFDSTAASVVVANSGTVDFPNMAGMLIATSYTSGTTVIWLMNGGTTSAVSNVNGVTGTLTFVTGINGYRWTNNTGSSNTLTFFTFRGRPDA